MHPTKNDLPRATREAMVKLLNARLADALDLGLQVKQAHWNVKGPSFIALHELFDDVYARVQEHTDVIAERAVQLGGIAKGTVDLVAERSTLPKYPTDIAAGLDHARALSKSLAAFGKAARAAIEKAKDDAGTADLFTQVSRDIDKYLWMVEAHLQAET